MSKHSKAEHFVVLGHDKSVKYGEFDEEAKAIAAAKKHGAFVYDAEYVADTSGGHGVIIHYDTERAP